MSISVIQAKSWISVMPGSLSLWSVHSGAYRGISDLASLTMVSKSRSSMTGAVSGIRTRRLR